MWSGIGIPPFLCLELLLEQLPGGVAPSESEGDRQTQHQSAERNGECGEHDGGCQPELFESHDRSNGDHEEAERAAEKAGGRHTGVDGREQRGAPDEVAHQKAQCQYQQSQQPRGTNRKNCWTNP